MPQTFRMLFREAQGNGPEREVICGSRKILLWGPAGCGKSRCAKAIVAEATDIDQACLLGSVVFGEIAFEFGGKPGTVRMGYVPENIASSFIASRVIEELSVGLLYPRGNEPSIRAYLARWLQHSPLSQFADRKISELSGGQKALLAIEAALSASPDVLIVDSGLEALDEYHRQYAIGEIERYLEADSRRYAVLFARAQDFYSGWSNLQRVPFPLPYLGSADSKRLTLPSDRRPAPVNEQHRTTAVKFMATTGGYCSNKHWTLRNVNFTIPAGTCIGITGPNGIGKSTLLRTLSGYLIVEEGDIAIFDIPLSSGLWPGRKNGIAYFSQGGESAMVFDQIEECVANGVCSNATGSGRRVASGSVSSQLMSPGERFWAAITGALADRPRIWFFDEPTGHVSPSDVADVIAHVRRTSPGAAIVIVSHDPKILSTLCDSVYEICQTTRTEIIPIGAWRTS